jgi:hypothetical protein
MSDRYDAGLLSDFGGGNVEWWQDYIRSQLAAAHEFYETEIAELEAELEAWQSLDGINWYKRAKELKAENARLLSEARKWRVEWEKHHATIGGLEAENVKLRKILAHVPGRIAIKAREDAGFSNYISEAGE